MTRARGRRLLVTVGQVLLNWVADVPRRLGDRLFLRNDSEAYWRGWQTARTRGGLGRRYRDPWFDALAECAKCRGAGRGAGVPCVTCLGTGRITRGDGPAPAKGAALEDSQAIGDGAARGENQARGEVG